MSNEVSRSHISTSPEMQEARDAMDAWIEADTKEMKARESLEELTTGFADALLEKLVAADKKYDHGDAWKKEDWRESLLKQLHDHIEKGDPLDVAAYCAFAWYHSWSIRQSA